MKSATNTSVAFLYVFPTIGKKVVAFVSLVRRGVEPFNRANNKEVVVVNGGKSRKLSK